MTIWLSSRLILAIHDEQLAEHGGSTGLRDVGLLDSALARPLNRAEYDDPDVSRLAAVYRLAIARDHPFVDGNKRSAFVALQLFLRLNGCLFTVGDAEAVVMTPPWRRASCRTMNSPSGCGCTPNPRTERRPITIREPVADARGGRATVIQKAPEPNCLCSSIYLQFNTVTIRRRCEHRRCYFVCWHRCGCVRRERR